MRCLQLPATAISLAFGLAVSLAGSGCYSPPSPELTELGVQRFVSATGIGGATQVAPDVLVISRHQLRKSFRQSSLNRIRPVSKGCTPPSAAALRRSCCDHACVHTTIGALSEKSTGTFEPLVPISDWYSGVARCHELPKTSTMNGWCCATRHTTDGMRRLLHHERVRRSEEKSVISNVKLRERFSKIASFYNDEAKAKGMRNPARERRSTSSCRSRRDRDVEPPSRLTI